MWLPIPQNQAVGPCHAFCCQDIGGDETGCSGRSTPGRAEAPDQAAKLEALHKKLLLEMRALQAAQLKTLRDDMRKESKRTEAATQAQVLHINSACSVTCHHNCPHVSQPGFPHSLDMGGLEMLEMAVHLLRTHHNANPSQPS